MLSTFGAFNRAVIPKERSDCGNAAIKPSAESNSFELCRGGAVKTEGQSPTYRDARRLPRHSVPRNDGDISQKIILKSQFSTLNSDKNRLLRHYKGGRKIMLIMCQKSPYFLLRFRAKRLTFVSEKRPPIWRVFPHI